MISNVSDSQRQAAEEIRSHLVSLRGGAPFLSPLDTKILLHWLEDDEPVSRIIAALERAAEARRKRPSRIPLGLRHATRHLKAIQPLAAQPIEPAQAHPLDTLCEELVQQASAQDDGLPLIELAADLHGLKSTSAEQTLRDALSLTRAYFEAAWLKRPVEKREQLIDAALLTLKTKKVNADEATLQLLAEERARQGVQKRLPQLSATYLREVLR